MGSQRTPLSPLTAPNPASTLCALGYGPLGALINTRNTVSGVIRGAAFDLSTEVREMTKTAMWFQGGVSALLFSFLVVGCGGDPNPADAAVDAGATDANVTDATLSDAGDDLCTTVGTTRACGSDEGECVAGVHTC